MSVVCPLTGLAPALPVGLARHQQAWLVESERLWFEHPGVAAHGLRDFDAESAGALDLVVDDVPVKVLPLERVIASKRSAGRPKDVAALPALEATLRARDGSRDDT
jgi:hypothetical protein